MMMRCLSGASTSMLIARGYRSTSVVRGMEEFLEKKKPNEFVATGRAWTASDLRRKVRN